MSDFLPSVLKQHAEMERAMVTITDLAYVGATDAGYGELVRTLGKIATISEPFARAALEKQS